PLVYEHLMRSCRPFLLGAALALGALPLAAQTWSGNPAGVPAQGFASALALAGDELLVGRTGGFGVGTGDILVYRRNARGGWISSGSFAGTGLTINDGFGSVLAADGLWLAVGAPGAPGGGKVHLFQRVGRRWSGVTTLASPDSTAGTQFGSAVAFQNGVLVVGAPGRDSLRGRSEER